MPTEEKTTPAICLNMIVRNEAHIVKDVLDATAPYLSSWVIVDTGSDDGTQDVIREHMAELGIPGELHEREWVNFGHNRTEALQLAQGHGDYIWVMDADDIVVGNVDFTGLHANVYAMRIGQSNAFTYWRSQLFRDGAKVHYAGVLHEYAVCTDDPCVLLNLEGDYHIESRRLGARSQDPKKYLRDAELLLAEVKRNPDDTRSVFYLAQSYFDGKDFAKARKWYARRAEMGGWAEEVFYSKFRVAAAMAQLGEPWPAVQAAYLQAWEYRPTRVEPLQAIARHYRNERSWQLGYLFARRVAAIPYPAQDRLFVDASTYTWRALDEQAICASWIDRHAEAFALCRRLIAVPNLPEHDRQRIASNRDVSVRTMLDAASPYPEVLAAGLVAGQHDAEVTVSLIAGLDPADVEQTLNSFLHCCHDVDWVGRFLVVDAGLSAEDRTALTERYRFLEFVDARPALEPGGRLGQLRGEIGGRFWLHLGRGWRFFAPEKYITRLIAVLEAEEQVFQVGVNFTDAARPTGSCATDEAVRRADDAGRYVLTDAVASGPAMFDTARLDAAGGIDATAADPLAELARTAAEAGLQTASLDEVLCTASY